MNGATAEPLLKTISPPKINKTITIGINQYFFLCLKKSINSKVDGNIIIKSKSDPNILGGLIVKVGSKLIDTSIRSKLAKLKNNLKEVG